jgi:hypothetical protein
MVVLSIGADPMTRDEYIRRFDVAAKLCRDFEQQMVIEELPTLIKFDINFTGSREIDGRLKLPWGGRFVYAEQLRAMDYIKARKLFWIDGRIPIWINFMVTRIEGEFTVIEIAASRDVTNDDAKLYPYEYRPFHILGQIPPEWNGWRKGERFSIALLSTQSLFRAGVDISMFRGSFPRHGTTER